MTDDDILIVADDLQYLREWGPDMSDGDIRRGSAVLRRLLVEDAYGQAWRAAGNLKQPVLVAVDLDAVATPDSISDIVFALAGGAHFRGMHLACVMLHKGTKPIGSFNPPSKENGYPGERKFTLSDYLSSLSGVVDGRTFNRREVIKYIANVKGGVHLSVKERKAEEKLIARLGKIEKKVMVHATDGLLVELAAIGQAVGKSDDARTFIQQVQR
jgi:hypothetical protein